MGHDGCSTESVEEAEVVAREVDRMLGTDWTNQHGETRPLEAADIMVVAPYNDQVNLIGRTLFDRGLETSPWEPSTGFRARRRRWFSTR
ncbi:MAG: hypothetical protein IPH38_09050 [Candidatus Microthrix sp.]|nr:hypothetical protein [Candidatus Microthrix sp.]MBK7019721.1 hypothetical protein [Candidatus Microthrix sp.]